MSDNEQKKITSERVIITSFVVDVLDVLVNGFAALVSGSAIMFSQTLEGAADLIASGFLLVGVKKSKQPSDKRHPYGYGRELYFWTFLSALVTFLLTAVVSFIIGLRQFLNPEELRNLPLSFIALVLAIATNGYAMSLSYRRLLGKDPKRRILEALVYPSLIETKTAFVLDLMGTVASILGLIALVIYKLTGDFRFDGIGAMAIGVTLATLTLFIIKAAKDLLVGQSASPSIEKKIRDITKTFPHVEEVLDLRTLHVGPDRLLVNIEVNLSDRLTTGEIELLIDKIEKQIVKEVPSAKNILIELETPDV